MRGVVANRLAGAPPVTHDALTLFVIIAYGLFCLVAGVLIGFLGRRDRSSRQGRDPRGRFTRRKP
jgi:hypothetical protein